MAYRIHTSTSVEELAATAQALSREQHGPQAWMGSQSLWLVQSAHVRDWLQFRTARERGASFARQVAMSDQGVRQILEMLVQALPQLGPLPVLFADSIGLLVYETLRQEAGLPAGLAAWGGSARRGEEDTHVLATRLADAFHAYALNYGIPAGQGDSWQIELWQRIFAEPAKGLPLGAALDHALARLDQLGPEVLAGLKLRLPDGRSLDHLLVFGSAFLPVMSLRFLYRLASAGVFDLDHCLFWPLSEAAGTRPELAALASQWASLGQGLVTELQSLGGGGP